MTHGEVVKAYPALLRLSVQSMDGQTAWKLYGLMQSLEQIINFQAGEERKLRDEFGGIENEDGTIRFTSKESFDKFSRKQKEISDVKVDFEIEKVAVNLQTIRISSQDIKVLSDFIEFVEGE